MSILSTRCTSNILVILKIYYHCIQIKSTLTSCLDNTMSKIFRIVYYSTFYSGPAARSYAWRIGCRLPAGAMVCSSFDMQDKFILWYAVTISYL